MKNLSKNNKLMIGIIIVLIAIILGVVFVLNKNNNTPITKNKEPKIIFYDNATFEYGEKNINLESLINKSVSEYDSVQLLNGHLIDTMKVGDSQNVTIVATNKDISKEFTFTYNVVDRKTPTIMSVSDRTTLVNEPIDLLLNVKAIDEVDGELLVIVEGDYKDFKEAGVFELKASATDKNGNKTELPFTLTVKEHEKQTEIIGIEDNKTETESILKEYKKYDDLKACKAALEEELENHKHDWKSNECSSDGIMYYRTLH